MDLDDRHVPRRRLLGRSHPSLHARWAAACSASRRSSTPAARARHPRCRSGTPAGAHVPQHRVVARNADHDEVQPSSAPAATISSSSNSPSTWCSTASNSSAAATGAHRAAAPGCKPRDPARPRHKPSTASRLALGYFTATYTGHHRRHPLPPRQRPQRLHGEQLGGPTSSIRTLYLTARRTHAQALANARRQGHGVHPERGDRTDLERGSTGALTRSFPRKRDLRLPSLKSALANRPGVARLFPAAAFFRQQGPASAGMTPSVSSHSVTAVGTPSPPAGEGDHYGRWRRCTLHDAATPRGKSSASDSPSTPKRGPLPTGGRSTRPSSVPIRHPSTHRLSSWA